MTAPETSHRATRENGPSVIDGRLIWTSASGITTADPHSVGGCLRKWFFDTVLGLKAPATKAQLGGTALHAEIENRLLTGATLQSPLALAGSAYIDKPGPGLYVEQPILFHTRGGVSIYGHVDLYNFRGTYIDENAFVLQDPPNTVEVKDWKTTSDLKYAKTPRELAENVQLVTYAEAWCRTFGATEHARLTHTYFRTRGAPVSKLVTIRSTRQEIASRWEYSESVVRSMADAAKEQSVDRVPANLHACGAYSGCPHRDRCSAYKFNSLDTLYGKIAEDHLREKEQMMGIIAQNPQMMQNAQAQQPSTMQQTLAAEEQQLRQQVAQQQAMPGQAQYSPAQVAEVCQKIIGYGYGFPTLGGNAAQTYAAQGGQQVAPGFVFNGQPAGPGARRSLHGIQLTEIAHLFQLEGELAREAGVPAYGQAGAHLGPQNMPTAVQASPVPATPAQGFQQQLAQAYNQQVQPGTLVPTASGGTLVQAPPTNPPGMYTPAGAGMPMQQGTGVLAGGLLPPDAPQSMPQLAQSHPAGPPAGSLNEALPQVPQMPTPPDPMQAQPEKRKRSPGRPKSQDSTPAGSTAPVQGTSPIPPAPQQQQAPAGVPSAFSNEAQSVNANPMTCVILINARFSNTPTKSLNEYVDYINRTVAERYNVAPDGRKGIADVRAAMKDTVLAFGGWPGVVREIVKADPPPPGLYHLDTFRDTLNEAVADALRVVADVNGWTYIRGMFG